MQRTAMRRGFTLLEVMVSVAIFGILSVIIAQMLMTGNKLSSTIDTKFETSLNMTTVMNEVAWKIRQAKLSTIKISREDSRQPFSSKIEFVLHVNTARKCVIFQQGNQLVQRDEVFNGSSWQPSSTKVLTRILDTAVFSMNMLPAAATSSGTEEYHDVLAALSFVKVNKMLSKQEKMLALSEKVRLKNL